jgi:hypothetical protein
VALGHRGGDLDDRRAVQLRRTSRPRAGSAREASVLDRQQTRAHQAVEPEGGTRAWQTEVLRDLVPPDRGAAARDQVEACAIDRVVERGQRCQTSPLSVDAHRSTRISKTVDLDYRSSRL